MDPKKISVQMMELTHNKEILTYLIIQNSSETELEGNWRLYSSMGLTPTSTQISISKTNLEGRYGYISPNEN